MRKDTFIFYMQWLRTMEDAQLNNAERMRLIDAIVTYADKGTIPKLPRLLTAIFSPIKTTIDNDAEKYAKIVAVSRENGAKGGRPKKPEKTEKNPVGYSGFSEKTEKTQSAHYDYDNVNDYDNVFVNDARSVAPDQKERNELYQILFWRNVVDPHREIAKFWEYNETRKWKALNTPSKRLKAATEWQPADPKPRVRPEFLDVWFKLYKRAKEEKGEFFAGGFIDPQAKCICQGSEAKIVAKDPAIREYIMQTRPPELLDYIGSLTLKTSAS
jgi:hypothetical protein